MPRPAHLSPASTPIDDFLSGSGGSAGGVRWEAIGFGLALAGVILSVGVVTFLARVHAGHRREVRALLHLARGCGFVVLVGGVVEVAGTATVLRIGWTDAFTGGSAASAMMRVLAGVLVLIGLGDELVPVEPATGAEEHRWVPGAASAFGLVGVGLGALSFAFDGHTTTAGPRVAHAAVAVVHVLAAGVWAGGIVALVVLAALRQRARRGGLAPLVVRFSTLATLALIAVVVAGVTMAVLILDDVDDLGGTDWGRRLLIKVAAVGAAALLGGYNRIVLVPRLATGSLDAERTIRTTITLEAVVLAFVVVVTVLLTRAATV